MNLILKYKNVAIVVEEGLKSLKRNNELGIKIVHLRNEKHYKSIIDKHPYAQYIKMDLYKELYVEKTGVWHNLPKRVRNVVMEDTLVKTLMRNDKIDSILK